MRKLIPQVRFPEFTGEWVEKKIGNISKKVNSGSTPRGGAEVYVDEGILFIRSQNVLDSKLSFENSTYIPNKINDSMKNSVVVSNDILLNITGASLGRSCVVPHDFTTGNVNQHVCIIRLDERNDPRFVQPIFSSTKGQNIFISLQTGSGREGLNFQSIRGISLPFPSLPEQTKIANFLTAVDEKLTALNQKKTLLEQYKKGVMQQIFGRDAMHGVSTIRFKDDNGNDYPDWEEKKLGDVYNFKVTNSFSRENLNYENGDVKNIHYGDIHTKFQSNFNVLNEIVPYINAEISIQRISEDNYCKEGDLVFADASEDYADIGKCIEIINLNNEKTLAGLHTLLARPDLSKISIGFGNRLMKSEKIRNQIMKIAQGSKVLSISIGRMSNLSLEIPSLPEQTKIANFLSAIDVKINHCQEQIDQTTVWKKGLLQQMFV